MTSILDCGSRRTAERNFYADEEIEVSKRPQNFVFQRINNIFVQFLRIELSGSSTGLGPLRCVFKRGTVLLQCLSLPRCINCYRQI